MFYKARKILSNEKGMGFLEIGLYVVLVIFVVAIAGSDLGGAVSSKFSALTETIKSIAVPSI